MHFYSAMFLVSCLGPGEKYYVEILPSEMFFFFCTGMLPVLMIP